jgi:hypothetical protein
MGAGKLQTWNGSIIGAADFLSLENSKLRQHILNSYLSIEGKGKRTPLALGEFHVLLLRGGVL